MAIGGVVIEMARNKSANQLFVDAQLIPSRWLK